MRPGTRHSPRFAESVVRITAVAVLLLTALAFAAPMAAAEDGGATWRWAPAEAPPPPAGSAPASFPVPLGAVGDIEFWAPNRGLLTTRGGGITCAESVKATVPCGLYAYNGVDWHLLSTECGGENGRIAWAGPEEFWTISDQRPGQEGKAVGSLSRISLCHFLDGQVVGSYAEPVNAPNSYLPLNAAACLNPDDCWFGGEVGKAPNNGAFHLHWDGQNVNVVYSNTSHRVVSMALANQSTLLESVEVTALGSGETSPVLLHQIEAPGSGVTFENLPLGALPEYGSDEPLKLGALRLSSDFTPSGSNTAAPQLWAIASGGKSGHAIALRYSEGSWAQVVRSGEPVFAAGQVPTGVAAEPAAAAAWMALEAPGKQAHVDRLSADGKVTDADVLGNEQGVGERGSAGPIACPAPHDCWLATSEGWLFHLTNDKETENPDLSEGYPEDTDPNFAGVIADRPEDPSSPKLPPNTPPPDDSLENQEAAPPVTKATVSAPANLATKPLVTDVSSHVVHRYTLELSFKLTVKARVQLVASRKKRRVAQTAAKTMKAGKHTVTLQLNPHSWPNNLDLKAVPLEALPTAEVKGVTGQTVAPPVKENSLET